MWTATVNVRPLRLGGNILLGDVAEATQNQPQYSSASTFWLVIALDSLTATDEAAKYVRRAVAGRDAGGKIQ
jgi:hypothetical protein